MNILFILDREGEEIDPNDALGDIIISNNQSQISIKSTYLDSWFDALIDGYESLEKNQIITIEIIEEPELITFEPLVNGFKISYGTQHIIFSRVDEFYQSLLIAVQDFIQQFKEKNIKLTNKFVVRVLTLIPH